MSWDITISGELKINAFRDALPFGAKTLEISVGSILQR